MPHSTHTHTYHTTPNTNPTAPRLPPLPLLLPPQGEGQSIVKRAWTTEEDQALLQLVQGHGPRPWSQIAKELPGRVGKQCRERWHNHVCPSVSKEEWTDAEDQLIMELVQQMGTKWSKVATMIPGRTDNAIKNRWNSTMRRILRQQLKDEVISRVVRGPPALTHRR